MSDDSKRGTIHYHAQLGHLDKGRTINQPRDLL